jgi:hypothetical protein
VVGTWTGGNCFIAREGVECLYCALHAGTWSMFWIGGMDWSLRCARGSGFALQSVLLVVDPVESFRSCN